jgi:hypothetical protein
MSPNPCRCTLTSHSTRDMNTNELRALYNLLALRLLRLRSHSRPILKIRSTPHVTSSVKSIEVWMTTIFAPLTPHRIKLRHLTAHSFEIITTSPGYRALIATSLIPLNRTHQLILHATRRSASQRRQPSHLQPHENQLKTNSCMMRRLDQIDIDELGGVPSRQARQQWSGTGLAFVPSVTI